MIDSLKSAWDRYRARLSRRDLFRNGGLLAIPALWNGGASAAAPSTGLRAGPDIYQSIGVRPLINCRGTLTVVGGSLELPEVRAAVDAASQRFVQLDELMEAVGARLAELTGAEWGVVTSGCAAGLAHATAACVAGGNPDLHVRIPNLAGFAKDEVVIPKHSRNVYDAAVRSIGVRVIEVDSAEELEAALGPRVAMIYIFAGQRADSGPLSLENVARIAGPRNIPILVDAAAEKLTAPNIHLQRGAAIVGYSGGKCLRGPQCAGILLGRKDLLKAAWVHSAPHHGYGRSMKVGKEEAIGMLMAVEMWMKRDHDAEMKQWLSWMNHIGDRVSKIDGVTATVREARGLSNHTPGLNIRWDPAKLGITGEEVSRILWTTDPRIALGGGGMRGGRGAANDTGISITAYMMSPGEERIVADRVHAILSAKRPAWSPPVLKPPAADLSGRWDVRIEFAGGASTHALHLQQNGNRITGTHQGDFVAREMSGAIDGGQVNLSSFQSESHGDSLSFRFNGNVDGETLSGDLDMGEYLMAKWTAKRHAFGRA